MPRSRLLVIIGWTISAVLLVGVVRSAPLPEIWQALVRIDIRLALAAIAFAGLNLWLRGGRWSLLLSPYRTVPNRAAASIAVIGLALNAVIPGRLGEMVRIGLAARRFRIGIAFTMATVVAERLFDALTLLSFLGVALLALPTLEPTASATVMGYEVTGATLLQVLRGAALACLILVVFILLLGLAPVRGALYAIVSKLPGPLASLSPHLCALLDEIEQAITPLRRPLTLLRLTTYSTLIWLALTLTNLMVSFGFEDLSLSLWEVLVMTAVSVAVSSLPSAPGAWGIFEAGALLALGAMEVQTEPAVAVAFVFAAHLCQYLPTVAAGLVLAVTQQISPTSVRSSIK